MEFALFSAGRSLICGGWRVGDGTACLSGLAGGAGFAHPSRDQESIAKPRTCFLVGDCLRSFPLPSPFFAVRCLRQPKDAKEAWMEGRE